LGDLLIDIHSQHQTRELSENQYQFGLIDSLAGNSSHINQYQQQLKIYKTHKQNLEKFQQDFKQMKQEFDYHQFLVQELQQLALSEFNQPELESESERLNHVEFIKEHLHKAYSAAQDESFGALHILHEIKLSLQKVAGFSSRYQSLSERVESLYIELKDITSDLEQLAGLLVLDPKRAEEIQQKLQVLYQLQKKHQVNSVAELIDIQENLQQKVLAVNNASEVIAQFENEIESAQKNLDLLANNIYENRVKVIPELTQKLENLLGQLGMPNARFKIELMHSNEYFVNGKDELKFLFAANLGTDFGALRKVASGGELSRIMLSAKATLAQYTQLPTLIFDEIDTGVSGEIAHAMGEIMTQMSQHMQVFSITHLPQIAAKGNQHFKVFKTISGANTTTDIKVLSKEERIVEIAQMLSGAAVSESALNHAKSLLN